ncbi:hypothetical protein T4E_2711 [Trichinella pseudospiralis]|uniref:Uncharacterized protein n=1 Tax=Trichinella pseudospiralis TaxID=6337 RepID=A0A0V0Y8C4_TRIPS|nr:hypothetical protein T4E_2711 [Trichinella pseudospiralis]
MFKILCHTTKTSCNSTCYRSTHKDVGPIPKCISTVKHEIYKCKVCRMHRPIVVQVPTAPLHVHPLQYREFPFVEWACFGPFVISRKQEMWGLIFMCLQQQELFIWKTAYRQTSSRFLLASERFIQRRGKPQSI